MKLLSSKPLLLILVAVVVFLLVFTGWMILAYNGFVARQQTVQAQWAQVENQYQRKIDLIPELVSVAYNYT
jgi:LemA protein